MRANTLSPGGLQRAYVCSAVARFASRCTCSTAGEVQRRWTGPPPTPISSNHTGRVTTRAESVGVHANIRPALHIVFHACICIVQYANVRACSVRHFPRRECNILTDSPRENRSSRRAAVQCARVCIASFLVCFPSGGGGFNSPGAESTRNFVELCTEIDVIVITKNRGSSKF